MPHYTIPKQELELAHEDAIRDLKQENDKNITKMLQVPYVRTYLLTYLLAVSSAQANDKSHH